jgi:hypothetical protein
MNEFMVAQAMRDVPAVAPSTLGTCLRNVWRQPRVGPTSRRISIPTWTTWHQPLTSPGRQR